MPESFSYFRKYFWYVIVARVSFSFSMGIFSFASMAWCSPSLQRRPAISRPVCGSTIITELSRIT